MSMKATIPSVLDILKSPEFTRDEVMDQKAFQIRTVIKSGKHGKVSLCDGPDDASEVGEVAIKSELIKSPKNPYSRPYREFFILKQLRVLVDRPEFYVNPRWIGYIQVLDWFKGKTDQIRITSTPTTPLKTPTKPVAPQTTRKLARDVSLSSSGKQAPRTAPRPSGRGGRMSYGDENEDVGNLSEAVTAIELTPTKRMTRVSATPTPKRVVPRTPLLMASANRQREIKLQEGNLVLERADATLYAMRSDFSFLVWRDLLFQVLYALYVGQTEYEFVHHDLHLQNVLLKRLKLQHVDHTPDVEANMGIFQVGAKKWYSRGPWIVKLSDFGLSRIKLVDGDGSVVYDLAQPLFEAFLADRDVLKILDEFSRVKITRWLSRNECVTMGVKMSSLKDSWFIGPEQTIANEDLFSVTHNEATIGKLEALIQEKQKSVKQIRFAIRKRALHLQELLQHEFFEPMMEQPTDLWLFEGNVGAATSVASPTRVFDEGNDDSFCETSDSPDSPPPVVKKLSFSDASLESVFLPKTTLEAQTETILEVASFSAPLAFNDLKTPPHTPTKDTSSPIETTPMRDGRRSARVSAKGTNSPRKLVKPDPSVLIHHDDLKVEDLHDAQSEVAKLPTPAKVSARKPRRNTLLPAELEASLNDTLGPVNRSLASLLINPDVPMAYEEPAEVAMYDPVPTRCLGAPMALPMSDKSPVNCIDALRDYLVRRSQQLEETRSKRKSVLVGFFVRNEVQISEARMERLARKRRRRPVRRSLGTLRRKSDLVTVAASRPRRKSLSASQCVQASSEVCESAEVAPSVVEEVNHAIHTLVEVSVSPAFDSSILASGSVVKSGVVLEGSESAVEEPSMLVSNPMWTNSLGLMTSPTAPRRSARRRSSLSVVPLKSVIPVFSLLDATHAPASAPMERQTESANPKEANLPKNLVKVKSVPAPSGAKPRLVTAKPAAAAKSTTSVKKAAARPPTPIKAKTSTAAHSVDQPRAAPSVATPTAPPENAVSTAKRAPSTRAATKRTATRF